MAEEEPIPLSYRRRAKYPSVCLAGVLGSRLETRPASGSPMAVGRGRPAAGRAWGRRAGPRPGPGSPPARARAGRQPPGGAARGLELHATSRDSSVAFPQVFCDSCRVTLDSRTCGGSVLLAFRAGNVRSFRDEVELTMLATSLAEKEAVRHVTWRE